MVTRHPDDVQILYTNAAVPLGVVVGRLKVEVTPLATDLEMLARDLTARFAAALTALLTTAHPALRMRQTLLPSAIVARILHHPALRGGQKYLQAHI